MRSRGRGWMACWPGGGAMGRMDEEPAWIELLFKRQNRHHCFKTPFLLQLNARQIEESLSLVPEERSHLRRIALQRLASDDIDHVVIALLALFVVGTSADALIVEPLTVHGDEYVKKAAKTCLFELRRRE